MAQTGSKRQQQEHERRPTASVTTIDFSPLSLVPSDFFTFATSQLLNLPPHPNRGAQTFTHHLHFTHRDEESIKVTSPLPVQFRLIHLAAAAATESLLCYNPKRVCVCVCEGSNHSSPCDALFGFKARLPDVSTGHGACSPVFISR